MAHSPSPMSGAQKISGPGVVNPSPPPDMGIWIAREAESTITSYSSKGFWASTTGRFGQSGKGLSLTVPEPNDVQGQGHPHQDADG